MNAIVAVCDDWGIGYHGGLLVRNRDDMRSFVAHTTGGTVIMGRKTLDGFPGRRPLKNRRNVVITHDASQVDPNAECVGSVGEALDAVRAEDPETVWVIGGASVYEQLLPYCDRVVVTKNHCIRPADAFFPNLDEDPRWKVEKVERGGTTPEGVPFEFVTYARTPDDRQACATWVAPNATVVGDVTLGRGSSVWYGAVIRADLAPVTIGTGSNVQDNAVIHVDENFPVTLGRNVTVGHGAIVHGCTVGDNTVIGMGAIVLDGARVGSNCIIGAGALVTQGKVVPDGTVWFGNPAKERRQMTPEDVEANARNAQAYMKEAARMAHDPLSSDASARQD